MRTLRYVVTALALAGGVTMGCSSSSSVATGDSGPDGETNEPDGMISHKDSGGKDAAKDTGKPGKDSGGMDSPIAMKDTGTDGPCNYATFVLGLIANDTTATATPSTDLGQTCTDDMKQSEFATLF